jgi:hypothetical protein
MFLNNAVDFRLKHSLFYIYQLLCLKTYYLQL